jgi:hypothetical protein
VTTGWRWTMSLDQLEAKTPPAAGAGVYAEYLKEQLTAEDARKASLEQRGLAVITTSGALVTLLFGLVALSTKARQTFELEDEPKYLLAVAVGVFLLAALCALATNMPVTYARVSPDAIRGKLKEDPVPGEDAARREIALTSVKVLRSAKRRNQAKARLLFAGLILEVAAVALVAAAMVWVIL